MILQTPYATDESGCSHRSRLKKKKVMPVKKKPNFKWQLQFGMSILVSFSLGFILEAAIFLFQPWLGRHAAHMACLLQSAVCLSCALASVTLKDDCLETAAKAHLNEFCVCRVVCTFIDRFVKISNWIKICLAILSSAGIDALTEMHFIYVRAEGKQWSYAQKVVGADTLGMRRLRLR